MFDIPVFDVSFRYRHLPDIECSNCENEIFKNFETFRNGMLRRMYISLPSKNELSHFYPLKIHGKDEFLFD